MHKITVRLSAYFAVALLLFAVLIGGLFGLLFSVHTSELHKMQLVQRAESMADTLSEYFNSPFGNKEHHHSPAVTRGGGYGAYLNLLDEIAMSDVWVLDDQLQSLIWGVNKGISSHQQLPDNALQVVQRVYRDNATYAKSLPLMVEVASTTVGAPIHAQDGTVQGVVLLHSPLRGADTAVLAVIGILSISIGAALVVAVLMAVYLSVRFTKPLSKMKNTAVILSNGDYTATTGVSQKDEIGQLAAALDTLAQQLLLSSQQSQQLEEMRQTFVANISHELRTPVTVLRGSLEALCDGVVSQEEQVQQYHQQMLQESLHLERLVADLLDLSRMQNVCFTIEAVPLNLADILTDVVRSMCQVAAKKQVALVVQPALPQCRVLGDYDRLRQILVIILDNAIKFSPPHSEIQMTLQAGPPVRLRICDQGVGIQPEDLPYIFERFYKSARPANQQGSGLGLAIAKQIADAHGMEIDVQSQAGQGSQFVFTFPL